MQKIQCVVQAESISDFIKSTEHYWKSITSICFFIYLHIKYLYYDGLRITLRIAWHAFDKCETNDISETVTSKKAYLWKISAKHPKA